MTEAESILGVGIVAGLLSAALAYGLRKFARSRDTALASKDTGHTFRSVPVVGGAAAFTAFSLVAVGQPSLVLSTPILAAMFGTLLLFVVGSADDRFVLTWPTLLLAQILAGSLLILGGVRLSYSSGILGGAFRLDAWTWHAIPIIGSFVVIGLVIAVTNAFNWLDGSDGVASAVGGIAFFSLAILALTPQVDQPPLSIPA